MSKRILIKGAGDLASAVAVRLYRAGYKIIMTDISIPTAVRRTVSFSRAVYEKEIVIEEIRGVLVDDFKDAVEKSKDAIAVIIDPKAEIVSYLKPDIVIDCIMAKKNIGTNINDANLVIGIGPGFLPGKDCHCCIETQRGHYLGRVFRDRAAAENTGIPGTIGGYSVERIIRAVEDGIFIPNVNIGDNVSENQVVAYVLKNTGEKLPIYAQIKGVVRGLLQNGVKVKKNMKSGDIDPRAVVEHCNFVSDKGLAIGGGVLEAVTAYYNNL